MNNMTSLAELARKSYYNDINNKNPRVTSVIEGESGLKDIDLYINSFTRTMKPILLKYMNEKVQYSIPKKHEDLILKIYDLLEGGEKTLRKIARKKYVEAKELKEAVDGLDISEEEKKEILNFFDYKSRLKIDDLRDEIINKLECSLIYILYPNTDYDSDTRDPKELSINDKRKYREEKLSTEDKFAIIEYINKKYDVFHYNALCLINDIAMTRKYESTECEEPIQDIIKRLSYWE